MKGHRAPALQLIGACAALLAAAPALAMESVDGKALFRRECGICHLAGGSGTFMLGRRLGPDKSLLEQRADLTGPYVRQVVRWGIVSMPRFSRVALNDTQLDAVVNYLTAPRPAAP